METKLPAATRAWWVILAWVVIYDVWALVRHAETISGAFYRGVQKKSVRWALAYLWAALSWHLFSGSKQVLPDKHHSIYRKVHPLWLAHDILAKERKNIALPEVKIKVDA